MMTHCHLLVILVLLALYGTLIRICVKLEGAVAV